MAEGRQFDPDRPRLLLDHGDVVELDGGIVAVNGKQDPSVVLRLTPWRARSLARALEQWSAISRLFAPGRRPVADELALSRTLEMAAGALDDDGGPPLRSPRDDTTASRSQRLAAVAVLAEREPRLSAVQRLALVDAAAWWMTDPDGGPELAHALIDGACSDPVTTQQVYLTLITPPQPD
ncbi:MAG TPA: hypothetical protein VN748_17750 [Pseudonocardiaceae bacterium]|jgi:hypothetical protein|nr:hypothetical protein [Pseudonocardiaceae bacterium]